MICRKRRLFTRYIELGFTDSYGVHDAFSQCVFIPERWTVAIDQSGRFHKIKHENMQNRGQAVNTRVT